MRRKRSDPTPPLGGNWRECTWCFGPHSWCARHLSLSLRTWRLPNRTWMIGMTGSTGRTLQEDIPPQLRPPWCMRKEMHGGRFMTLSTGVSHWWRPWRTSRRTSSSGLVRSMREWPKQRPKGTLPRVRARPRPRTHPVRHWVFTNHSGRSQGREIRKDHPPREVERPKAKAKRGRLRANQIGLLTGHSGTPSRWAIAVTSTSIRHVKDNVADPTIAQWGWMDGFVMLHHRSTQQLSAHTSPSDRPPSPSGAAGPEKGRTQGSVATAPTPEEINHTQPAQVERTPPRGQSNTPTFTWIPGWITSHRGSKNASNRKIPPRSPPQLSSCFTQAKMTQDPWMHAYMPTTHTYHPMWSQWRDPGSIGNDMLQDHPYNLFCSLASQGQILLVCGGPNCRTCILRWFPKPNAPPPVRGRSEAEVWGLEALTDQAQSDVDDDSILMLRQFYLTSLTYQGLEQRHPPIKGGSWVEHPSDPSTSSMSPSAWRCSSIWNTQAYKLWAKHLKHRQVNFDECMLGQVSAKPTTISTGLELAHWRQMFCQHDRHQVDPGLKSSDLSRYPWDMMRGLAQAISNHCAPLLSQHTQQVTGGVTAQAASPKTVSGHTPPPENQAKRPWQDHIGETVECSPKTPPKKQRPEIKMSPEKSRSAAGVAAITTLTAGAKGENTSPEEPTTAHLEASDRPTVVPRAGVVDLRDPVVQLNLAFKMRPLQDGGGKPSMGRLPPSRRPRSSLGALGAAILALSQEWIEPMKLSLSCGEKQHPFPESLTFSGERGPGLLAGRNPAIRATTLPPTDGLIGQKIGGPRPWVSCIVGRRSPFGGDFPHSHITRSMAPEVGTVWGRSCPWRFGHTHRSGQL